MDVNHAKPHVPTLEEWERVWWGDCSNDPEFHRTIYTPYLLKYHDLMFPAEKRGRVFVPCCGKSLDMIYLADRGDEVVGLEYTKGAVERFFVEQSLTYSKEQVPNEPFVLYIAKEKNIKIYQGDIFKMKSEICGQFDAAFDRGSYGSMAFTTHEQYGRLMASVIKQSGKILLETFTGPPDLRGPPYIISEKDIDSSFVDFETCTLETDEWRRKEPVVGLHNHVQWRVSLLTRK